GPMLAAAARRAGADAVELDVARDDASAMRALVEEGLTHDVLLLSGGVSVGVKDLVPSVLAELGVAQVFHKVSLKPGKPLWFGYRENAGVRTLVFGLPGNPVSSLVCFEVFVRPALAKLAGIVAGGLRRCTAILTSSFHHRGNRPTYHPARLVDNGERDSVELISWQGSSDLAAVANADALAIFEAGDKNFSAGAEVETLLL
ncbi:MAG: molybdopterin-binding protein, partial [Pirellulales bacterium]|nr:molybdopterin-binding protein [Pirellulales bacterium]